MTGLPTGRLADLIGRVREIVGEGWEKPPVGRPHVLPLPTAVVALLFGLRHNLNDEVLAEVSGCSRATITRYHEILQPILRATAALLSGPRNAHARIAKGHNDESRWGRSSVSAPPMLLSALVSYLTAAGERPRVVVTVNGRDVELDLTGFAA